MEAPHTAAFRRGIIGTSLAARALFMGSPTSFRAEALKGTLRSKDAFAALSQTYLHQAEPLGMSAAEVRAVFGGLAGLKNSTPTAGAFTPCEHAG